jgi:NAD(P)-dependent dehydrogenase (short-subunit alcohol dehydrogenase family)
MRVEENDKAMNLVGKVALVTGASRGIGKGVAHALGEAGATVYVTGRSRAGAPPTVPLPGSIDETASLVDASGGRGIAVEIDHTDDAQNAALVQRILAEQGRIDLLVNNAWSGYQAKQRARKRGASGFKTPFWKLPPAYIDTMFAVGVRSTYFLSTLVSRSMVERQSGLIVHISANVPPGTGDNVAYAASKAAVNAMAMEMGRALRAEHVSVVGVVPDHVATEMMMSGRKSALMEPWMESPFFVGMVVRALLLDPLIELHSGQNLRTRALAKAYGIKDIDGHEPVLRE